MSKDILITGFPSFVARRTLTTVIAREPDALIRLIVRPDYVDRADQVLDELGVDRERVLMFSGDVVSMDLGLSGREYLELITHVTDIYHIASIWYLGVNRHQTYDVNVTGAQNIIDAATEMPNLRRLNHFSTAFVAGDREGVIMEDELELGQRFRNAYEETKYEAERLMRAAMSHLPISVYRPSIVVGDSHTGEIDKLAGPYYLMYAIMLAPPNIPMVMPGKGDKPLNLVPIDFVCEAMHMISSQEDTASKTFHLCDPNPLSARHVYERVAAVAGKRAPIGGVPFKLARALMKFPGVEKLTRTPRQFMDDFNQLTIYNSINTLEALGGEIACPPLTTYLHNLIDYIKQHEGFELEMPAESTILG